MKKPWMFAVYVVMCGAVLAIVVRGISDIRQQYHENRNLKQEVQSLKEPVVVSDPIVLHSQSGSCTAFTVLPAEKQVYYLVVPYYGETQYSSYDVEMWFLDKNRNPIKRVWAGDLVIDEDDAFRLSVRQDFLRFGQSYYLKLYGLAPDKPPVEIVDKYGFIILPEEASPPAEKPCV